MILADKAAFKAAAGAMGLDGSEHLIHAVSKAHHCQNGLLDEEEDVATMSDKSDLSESDLDARPGSKRKARKRSAKVNMFITHLARFDHIFSARDSQSGREH